jgi:hypothetical protein
MTFREIIGILPILTIFLVSMISVLLGLDISLSNLLLTGIYSGIICIIYELSDFNVRMKNWLHF